jgi:[ribosomal protein S18]-alanine N-acetyltransferase
MSARLRLMTAADLPTVAGLERELFPEDAWSWEMFTDEVGDQATGRHYLVAEADGEIVGYAGLLAPLPEPPRPSRRGRPAGPEPAGQGDVLTMAVATGRWGQGIGSQLLTALLTEAARRDCSEVFLEVRADNPRAQELYRRHGFSAVGLRRGYYQPSGTDAIVMRRPLDAAHPVPAPRPASPASPARPASGAAAEPASVPEGRS